MPCDTVGILNFDHCLIPKQAKVYLKYLNSIGNIGGLKKQADTLTRVHGVLSELFFVPSTVLRHLLPSSVRSS